MAPPSIGQSEFMSISKYVSRNIAKAKSMYWIFQCSRKNSVVERLLVHENLRTYFGTIFIFVTSLSIGLHEVSRFPSSGVPQGSSWVELLGDGKAGGCLEESAFHVLSNPRSMVGIRRSLIYANATFVA